MVQIKNRVTGLYDRKGRKGSEQWTSKPAKRGVWGTIGQAKSHVAQFLNFYDEDLTNIRWLMDADFIILDDEYSKIDVKPVSEYILSKLHQLIEEYKDRQYYSRRVDIAYRLLKEYEH
jgi:hypothetical protein